MTEKQVLVLSDLHCGHNFAPAHPDSEISMEDKTIELNKIQKQLWESWKVMVKQYVEPDILVINGEPIQGADSPTENWTNNIIDQVEGAKLLIDMIKPKKIYLTRGSKWHVTLGKNMQMNAEEYFGKIINAEKNDGRRAPINLWLKVDGVIFNFAHKISVTRVPHYRSTAITREMFVAYVNQKHLHNARAIIRSHVHYFWHVESENHHGFITPPWQLKTEFSEEFMGNGGVASLGAIRPRVVNGVFRWDAEIDKFLVPVEGLRPRLVEA